jgi:Mrp family chromosome partitioning ATPase
MSQWFDTLYKKNDGTSTPDATPDTADGVDLSALTGKNSSSRKLLQRPAPLSGIPSRWSLEVQKVVFHLRPEVGDQSAPHHVVFSGLQRGPGVSTICFLVAHHIATEGYQQRVLYVNFNPAPSAPAMPNADATLYIGQPIDENLDYHLGGSTLTSLAIRSSGSQSVSIASGWLYEFMSHARAHYEWVFVDAPPFFATPETYSIAKACDGVVLVLKSGETRYPALKALVSDLDSLGIPIIGTVLNFRQYPLPKWLLRYV